MLVQAVHHVQSQSATVPFAVILIQDLVSSKKTPEGMRCRQVRLRAAA